MVESIETTNTNTEFKHFEVNETKLAGCKNEKEEKGEKEEPKVLDEMLLTKRIEEAIVAAEEEEEKIKPGHNRLRSPSNLNPKLVAVFKSIRAYIYGLCFALSMCMASILIKMAPTLDGSNHSAMRYAIQMIVMLLFIKANNLEVFGPKEQRKLLILRGVVGSAAVISTYFSIKYLDVSDVETLTNSCVIITAIFSRIFLKEKLTICHVVALVLTICGVFFILRPSFLFGIEHDLEHFFHVNFSSSSHLNQSVLLSTTKNLSEHAREFMSIKDHSNRELFESVIGVSLALFSAFCMSIAQVAIRKLCLVHIHFSVTSLYPAIVGLPASLIISGYLIKQELSHKYLNDEMDTLIVQIFYSAVAGVFGTIGIIFLNRALKYEDATKIGILKTSGVLFSFFLQYIFLDISVDFLGLFGAVCVIAGTLSVMAIKLVEPKISKSSNYVLKLLMTQI